MRPRAGFMLAEALCALALAGVLALACGTALTQGRALLARTEARARAERAGLEASQVVSALVRDADSLVVLGDTAIEFQQRIADGVVCSRDGAEVVLPPVRSATGASLLSLAQPIEPGDEMRAWIDDTITAYRAWHAAIIDSVAMRTGESPCGSAGGFVSVLDASEARARIVVPLLDARVGAGTPVRVGRRGRLSIYSVGGGQWMLGLRRCAHGACGVVQPVAGPLARPAEGGFRVRWTAPGALEVRIAVPGIPRVIVLPVLRTDAGH